MQATRDNPGPRKTARKLARDHGWAKAYHIAGDTASRFARRQDDPRWDYWTDVTEALRRMRR